LNLPLTFANIDTNHSPHFPRPIKERNMNKKKEISSPINSTETQLAKIAVFKGKQIRKTLHNNEWWFVVNDVVEELTDTPNVKDYIKKMRNRDNELAKGWGQFVTPLLAAGMRKALIRINNRLWKVAQLPVMPAMNWKNEAGKKFLLNKTIFPRHRIRNY
jgi:hypothetical protein